MASRRLAGSTGASALALLLALGAAAPALAQTDPGQPGNPSPGNSNGNPSPGDPQGNPSPGNPQGNPSPGNNGNQSPGNNGNPSPGNNANPSPPGQSGRPTRAPAPGKTKAPGQSNGNSGSVHVDSPGCALRVDFYGFNMGSYTVRVVAHPPTGAGELLASDTVTVTQPRIPASRFQTAITFDLSGPLGAFNESNAGYHVKILVTNPRFPNGAKQKVTWLNCPRLAAESAGGTSTENAGGTGGGSITVVRGVRTLREGVQVNAVKVLGVSLSRAGSPPGVSQAAANNAVLSGALPRTGVKTDALLWIALAMAQWGAIILVAGRLARPKASATA